MRRPHGDPLLTTQQVAEMCGTTEDTIRHFAERGDLVGHLSGTAWEFPLSEAQRFCEARRGNRAPRGTAGPSGPPRPSPVRRAGGVGLEVLNASASVVSLATAVGLDSNRAIGFALAAVNMLLVALRKVWTAIRRRARERAIADGRADPAEAWRAGGGGLALLTGLQVVCLAATVAFLAVVAAPPPMSGADTRVLR